MDVVNLITPAAPTAKAEGKRSPEPAAASGGFDDAMVSARSGGAHADAAQPQPGVHDHAPPTSAKPRPAAHDPAHPAPAKADPRQAQAEPAATLLEQLDAADLLAPKAGAHAADDADTRPHAAHHRDEDPTAQPATGAATAAQVVPLLAALPLAMAAPGATGGKPLADDAKATRGALRGTVTAATLAPASANQAATTASKADALAALTQGQAHAAAARHALSPAQAAKAAALATAGAGHAATPGSGSAFMAAALGAADASTRTSTPGHGAGTPSTLNGLFGFGALAHVGGATQVAATAPAAPLVLPSAVGSSPWQQELGMQLVQLTQRGGHQMELQLNPKDLGPLTISLTLDHHNAQAQFFAAHAVVRDAVQQAIPELRAALAGQGIALGQAMVGQQQQQQAGTGDFANSSARGTPASSGRHVIEGVTPTAAPRVAVRIAPGAGVDLYA